MEEKELKKIIETLLFITDEPLSADKIAKICDIRDVKYVSEKLQELKYAYDMEGKALTIISVAGGWQMSTRPEYGIWVRKLYNSRLTLRLSNAALEVLSIIAFKQPITRAEIEAIRGVDSSGPIDTLIERKLITNIGRKETLGRPILYGTTDEFLKQFGLNSIKDLPNLDSIISQDVIKNIDDKMKSVWNVKKNENISEGSTQPENKEEDKKNLPDNKDNQNAIEP